MQIKETMRKELLARRTRLSSDDVDVRSASMRAHLLSWLPSMSFDTVCLFQPFRGEPNLMPLLRTLTQRMLLPVVQSRTAMAFYQVDAATPYKVNAWGIQEPLFGDADQVVPTAATLVLVPALAADVHGGRLGYGGGFYDRYFATSPATLMTALYDEFVMQNLLPREPHDVRIHYLLTESGVMQVAP